MGTQDFRLGTLLTLIDLLPELPASQRGRGRPPAYDDRLFVKAAVLMLVRRVTTVYGLLSLLAEETPQMQALRTLLTESGRFPSRRTWERRLWSVVPRLPEYIASLSTSLGGSHPTVAAEWASGGSRQHGVTCLRRGVAYQASGGRDRTPPLD